MAEVPAYGSQEHPPSAPAPSITVHALASNKRPIGFAPWPEPKRRNKPAKRKKAA